MDNVRPKSLTAEEAEQVTFEVNDALDRIVHADAGLPPGQVNGRALRLEVANAARRWAARVDDAEFPPPVRLADGSLAPPMLEGGGEVYVPVHSMDDFDDIKTDPVVSRINDLPLRAPWEGTDG